MKIFGRTQSDELTLVLDIGSASVGGALVRFSSEEVKPTMLISTRAEIVFQDDLNFESFLSLMLQALGEVVKRIHDAKLGAPTKVHCFLASPWYASQTRVIKLVKENSFTFTQRMANELIEKEVKTFEEAYASKYKTVGQSVKILEQKIVRVLLNGYRVKEPIGLKAHDLAMTLYVSIAPVAIIEAMEEAIRKQFHIKSVAYTSFSLASFITTRDMFVHEDSFLLIDIGGEITEVSVIKEDMLLESVSFPYGKNFLLRKISRALKKNGSEALSLYRIYADVKLEKGLADALSKILAEAQKEWLEHFAAALADISKEFTVPDIVFVTADKDTLSWFVSTLESEQFHQYTTTERQFRVIPLTAPTLNEHIAFTGDILRDPVLMLETIFITRLTVQ